MRCPPCSRCERPGRGLLDQPPHGAHAARRDAEPFLGEPGPLEVVAAAESADHGVLGHLHVGEAHGGMAVGVGVGEGRVVDDLDALVVAVHEEQRRQLLAVLPRLGHDDVDGGHVPVGDEPLLAVENPTVLAALGDGGDARRIGARVGLGDRVGVVQLAPQGGLEVTLDLLRGAARQHVVGGGHVPGEGIGRAPELLLDQKPLHLGPALPAVLGGVEAAGEPGLDRLALDALFQLVTDLAAALLGQLLVGDEDLVDEAASALLEVPLLGCQVGGGGRRGCGGDGHRSPPGRLDLGRPRVS